MTRLEDKNAEVNANPLETAPPGAYLSELSPQDKPWDRHRSEAMNAQTLFAADADHDQHVRYAERIHECARMLEMGYSEDEGRIKLKRAFFCHVRWCPVCGWRKSLAWKARMLSALPAIQQAHPTGRWLFLTLTIKNCDVADLRSTLAQMSTGWKRLIQRKQFPAIGTVRGTEVTHSASVTGDSHPHFHILMMVPHSYFQSGNYLEHSDWVRLWRESMRLDYDPTVRIQKVRPKEARNKSEVALHAAIAETLKYSLKPADLVEHSEWFLELTDQLHGLRAVNPSGVFREFLRDEEPEADEMIGDGDGTTDAESWFFAWREAARRYALR
jgi:plasmid rolling circle replication initiator protein Rep